MPYTAEETIIAQNTDNTKTSIETAMSYVVEKKLKNLQSSSTILLKMTPMKKDDILGRKFLMPVCLGHSVGITYGDATVYALNAAVAATFGEAVIDPTPVTLRERVSQSVANRWNNGNDKSVINNVALRAGVMQKSIEKFAEIDSMHGRTGIGVVEAITGTTGTTLVMTITAATWASGIFAGMKGLALDVYDTTLATQRTNSATKMYITAIDHDNRKITCTGDSGDAGDVVATDVIFVRGSKGAGQYGLMSQLSATAQTSFGIDNSVEDLWRPNSHNVAGALDLPSILAGQVKAVNRGGLDEDVVLLVSTASFETLNASLSALREFGDASSKIELGFSSIKYRGQAGLIEIVAHPYVMGGNAISFPKEGLRRVGATDIAFVKDDTEGYWKSLGVTGYAGFQCEAQYEFQLFVQEPAKAVLYYGIV